MAFEQHDRDRLRRVESLLGWLVGAVIDLRMEVRTMAGELDALEAQVTAVSDAEDAAIALLNGLFQQLQDAINSGNPARIQAVTTTLKAKTDALAAAIVANTPAASPTP